MTAHFRFGVSTNSATSARELKERARRLEGLGYHSLLFQDHYLGPGPALTAARHPPQDIAAVPAAAVAADATSTLVVGFRVLCVDYHHPVVLAKELASLDLLSEGRLEIGLGAGWMAAEYAAMGVRLDPPAARIARLRETVEFLGQFFGRSPVEYAGSFVTASGFDGTPARPRRPPLAIGGGSRNILSLAARHADVVSVNLDMRTGVFGAEAIDSGDAMDEKLGWIRAAAGTRAEELVVEIGAHFVAVTTESDADAAAERMTRLPPNRGRAHPHALVGSVEQICDLVQERRERYGISYLTIHDRVAESFAPVVARLAGR
jgi:probable F420-dependent oxidoreductase